MHLLNDTMVWEGGSRKRSRPPPVKWSDTACLTTMPPGRWMFSVLSGSSNARSWAGGYFPNSHVRMHAFRLFWKERKCSPLLTSFCPPHSHEVHLVPHPSALPVCHLLSALGTQPSSPLTQVEKNCFKTLLVSQITRTHLTLPRTIHPISMLLQTWRLGNSGRVPPDL